MPSDYAFVNKSLGAKPFFNGFIMRSKRWHNPALLPLHSNFEHHMEEPQTWMRVGNTPIKALLLTGRCTLYVKVANAKPVL
jgi:hypothetical protein